MERLCRVVTPGFFWPAYSNQRDAPRIVFLKGSGAAGTGGGSALKEPKMNKMCDHVRCRGRVAI